MTLVAFTEDPWRAGSFAALAQETRDALWTKNSWAPGRYPAPIGDVQGIGQKIDVLAEAVPVPSQRKAHIPDFCGKRARANVVDGDPSGLRKQARIKRLKRKAQGLGHAAVAYIDCA